MRRGVAILLSTSGLALLLSHSALADTCSCTAPDHSCNASVTCTGGCYAICGSGGNCSSGCEGGGGGPNGGIKHEHLIAGEPESRSDLVSLDVVNLTGVDVANLLTDLLGSDVQFLPVNPGEMFSINVIDFPRGELAQALAKFGLVAVGETNSTIYDGDVGEAEVTIRLQDTTMGQVVGLIQGLVAEHGVTIQILEPDAPFSLDVQRMPLKTLLKALAGMDAIRLEYDAQ